MRGLSYLLAVLLGLWWGPVSAGASNPTGTWLISQRIALNIYDCGADLCGRVVWLRNPALRTPDLCGRVVVWGLKPDGSSTWAGGWFYDPEDGRTYNVRAQVDGGNRIRARIYAGIAWFGRTEILTRVAPRSLAGWCES